MKDKWLRTDRAGKIRLIVLALIMAWCAYCVIAYSREIYDMSADTSSMLIDTKTVGPINIDGSDFTAIFKGLAAGSNALVVTSVLGIYVFATAVFTLIPIFLYWLIAIRKAENVSAEEAELAMNICGLGGFVSVIVGILITGFASRMPAVLLTLVWLLPAFPIIVIPLRKRINA